MYQTPQGSPRDGCGEVKVEETPEVFEDDKEGFDLMMWLILVNPNIRALENFTARQIAIVLNFPSRSHEVMLPKIAAVMGFLAERRKVDAVAETEIVYNWSRIYLPSQ